VHHLVFRTLKQLHEILQKCASCTPAVNVRKTVGLARSEGYRINQDERIHRARKRDDEE
jgi:hypothetical protein